jgi:hypothetical protein
MKFQSNTLRLIEVSIDLDDLAPEAKADLLLRSDLGYVE